MRLRYNRAMQVRIASFEPDHWQDAFAICSHHQVARFLGTDPAEPAESWQKKLVEIDTSRYYRLGAFDGDSLVGILSLEIFANPRARHTARVWLAVSPLHHGKGIGTSLLSRALETADRWLNLVRVELNVHADHEHAIRLYARHGFLVEAERKCDMLRDGAPINAYSMSRLRPGFSYEQPPPKAFSSPRLTSRANVLIREAQPHDGAGVAGLFDDDSVSFGTLQFPLMPRMLWKRRVQQSLEQSSLLVAEENQDGLNLPWVPTNPTPKKIAGVVGILGMQNSRMKHIRSIFIAVHKDFQGQGVGRRLMQAALDLCDGPLQARRVELSVYTDNKPAVDLYQKLGFVLEGRLRCNAFRDGHYVDSYAMARIRRTVASSQ
jgi:putative acetyltransferase